MDSKEHFAGAFDNLLFPKIFQTFRMSIQLSKLIIAFLAVAVIFLAGWIMDFSNTVVVMPDTQGKTTELQIYVENPEQFKSFLENYELKGEHTGVFITLWHFACRKLHGMSNSIFELNFISALDNLTDYLRALKWAVRYHLIYSTIFFTIKFVVMVIAGGAICRAAAMQFARGERTGVGEALRFSIKKFKSFFAAPLLPLAVVILAGLPVLLLGLLANIPYLGELIMSIFMPLALAAGFVMAVIIIGAIAGFNLMFPAIAYDNSDSLDAISRSLSYVYAKPWRMTFYSAIAAVYGAICYAFVRFFAFLLLWVVHSFLRLGIWVNDSSGLFNKLNALWAGPAFENLGGQPVQAALNRSESIAAFLIHLNVLVIIGLVIAFFVSFYFSANTIIYSLMRNRLDNTALDKIYIPSENSELASPDK